MKIIDIKAKRNFTEDEKKHLFALAVRYNLPRHQPNGEYSQYKYFVPSEEFNDFYFAVKAELATNKDFEITITDD